MFLVSSCSYISLIHWSRVLSREWGCSWTGDAPTTSGWSTISLPTKVRLILEVWWYMWRLLLVPSMQMLAMGSVTLANKCNIRIKHDVKATKVDFTLWSWQCVYRKAGCILTQFGLDKKYNHLSYWMDITGEILLFLASGKPYSQWYTGKHRPASTCNNGTPVWASLLPIIVYPCSCSRHAS